MKVLFKCEHVVACRQDGLVNVGMFWLHHRQQEGWVREVLCQGFAGVSASATSTISNPKKAVGSISSVYLKLQGPHICNSAGEPLAMFRSIESSPCQVIGEI